MATSSNTKLMATNKDRLSSLPEETLLHILSFLPIKHAIRTSILSNRWRSLWTFNPNISFSYEDDCSPTDFAHFVNNSLLRYNANTIHRFSIDNLSPEFLHDFCSYTQGWIRFATNRGVQEVILKVTETPDFLFFHTPLKNLFVTFGTFYSPPGFNHVSGFPCLKVLQLSQLQYSNITSDAVCSSLFACPSLEKLTIRNCDVAQILNIYSPNACLRIVELWWCRCLKKLHVNAPNLVYFKYHGNESIDIYLETAQPKLVKAQVYFRDNIHPLMIRTPLLTSMANVTYLETSSWFSQFIFAEYWVVKAPHIVFNNLKEFKWFGYLGSPELVSLAAFLADCSLLQKLHINIEYPVESECYDQHRVLVKDKKARLQQLDYSLPRLKTIEVIGFSATKEEMSMVGFLLAKTPILDLLLLKSRSAKDTKDDWADWPGRPNWPPKCRLQEHPNSQLQEQLFSLPKSSKHAQIVLSRTSPGSKREMLRWMSWSPEVPNVYFSALPDD